MYIRVIYINFIIFKDKYNSKHFQNSTHHKNGKNMHANKSENPVWSRK